MIGPCFLFFPLCPWCLLCAAVFNFYHRDTEKAQSTHRNLPPRQFRKSPDGLVQVEADALGQLRWVRHAVGEEDGDGLLGWIGAPPTAVGAGPAYRSYLACARDGAEQVFAHHHRQAEPEAEILLEERRAHERGLRPLRRGELVAAHHLHRFGLQDPHAIRAAALHKQLRHLEVIAHGGPQALPARLVFEA